MRLTAKSSYALTIIGHLAEKHQPLKLAKDQDHLISASEISSTYAISESFVTSILREMKLAGLVIPKKGPGGGYTLSKSSEDIKIKDIFAAISEQPLSYQPDLFNSTSTGARIVSGLGETVGSYLDFPVSEFVVA